MLLFAFVGRLEALICANSHVGFLLAIIRIDYMAAGVRVLIRGQAKKQLGMPALS